MIMLDEEAQHGSADCFHFVVSNSTEISQYSKKLNGLEGVVKAATTVQCNDTS